jgi:hypothetical protein
LDINANNTRTRRLCRARTQFGDIEHSAKIQDNDTVQSQQSNTKTAQTPLRCMAASQSIQQQTAEKAIPVSKKLRRGVYVKATKKKKTPVLYQQLRRGVSVR